MEKTILIAIFSLLFLSFSSPAISDSGDSGWQKITSIRPYSVGTAIINIEGSFTQVNCNDTTRYRIDDVNGPEGSHLYATVLAAFMAGKQVRAYFTGACTPAMNRVEFLEIK